MITKAKKSLGQNFLIDENILEKIIRCSDIKDKEVLEVGPGTGNLTNKIIQQLPKKIFLIEKDTFLLDELKNKVDYNIEFINEDILKIKENELSKEKLIVFGNLPYNISTEILTKWILNINSNFWFDKLILMFQKEVADRIISHHNTSNYGRLSIISNYRLKIINSFDVTNNCFFPKPKVDSTVLIFKPFIKDNDKYENFEKLEYITKVIFSNKRKMINKALNKLFQNNRMISKKYDLNLKSRPSEISKKTFYKLADFYKK